MTWEDSLGNETLDNTQQPSLMTVHSGAAQNLAEHSVPTQPGMWSDMIRHGGRPWRKLIEANLGLTLPPDVSLQNNYKALAEKLLPY